MEKRFVYQCEFIYRSFGKKIEPVNPCAFFFNSEDYFTKIILLKSELDKLIKEHQLPTIVRKRKLKRKPIR